tara:strand:- start:101 stop:622 length:522 start_codon:yes stop_codon:yes gene_type:complete
LILTKLFLTDRCCKKKRNDNFYIKQLIIKNNNDLHIIKNNREINNIIKHGWYSIKQYNINITMIDIMYSYDNIDYNIIFKYPNEFKFPFEVTKDIFETKILALTDENGELDNLFNNYLGPQKDFYKTNNMQFSIKDICVMNSINVPNTVSITFYDLREIKINIFENIINYLKI